MYCREFIDRGIEILRVDNLIDEADRLALAALQSAAPVIISIFVLAGPMSWTSRRVSGTGAMKPNLATGMPNLACAHGDPKIAGGSNNRTAADRVAIDSRDHRLGCRSQTPIAALLQRHRTSMLSPASRDVL